MNALTTTMVLIARVAFRNPFYYCGDSEAYNELEESDDSEESEGR